MTAATQRAILEAEIWCSGAILEAPALLLGLLSEPECRAAMLLQTHDVDTAAIQARWPSLQREGPPEDALQAPISIEDAAEGLVPRFSPEIRTSLAIVDHWLTDLPHPLSLATEHLLMGLVAGEHEVGDWLRQKNFDAEALRDEILDQFAVENLPLEIEAPAPLPAPAPTHTTTPQPFAEKEVAPIQDSLGRRVAPFDSASENANVLRLLDASANRAREALRVIEDYVRFALDDRHLTKRLKTLRHGLTSALAEVSMSDRLAMRDTQADVGTTVSTSSELVRQNANDVLTANFTRLQETLRSLEEFGKTGNLVPSQVIEQLRYDAYTLHKAIHGTTEGLERLDGARLYVLVNGCSCLDTFEQLISLLVEAGVDIIQLRDKTLGDRDLLDRARRLQELTASSKTLFVMNDRPDLAMLAAADGVHVGQEELTVRDARQIVGPRMLVGVSTHDLDQARRAVLDGASYLGVGPTFPSGTKAFKEFPGLEFARSVAAEIRLPAFAIGGIDAANIGQVLATGIGRVAVSGAIVSAKDPAGAARDLLARLKAGVQ